MCENVSEERIDKAKHHGVGKGKKKVTKRENN